MEQSFTLCQFLLMAASRCGLETENSDVTFTLFASRYTNLAISITILK